MENSERTWVVEFGCPDDGMPTEAVIRTGESIEDVNYPDDLGCPVLRIRPLVEVDLKPGPMMLWRKGGELRCEPV
jgi:hypothetical protein